MSDTDEDICDVSDLLGSCRSKRQIRGVKDFAPDGSSVQAEALQKSRNALFHLIKEKRHHSTKTISEGILDRSTGLTSVIKPKGNHFRVMGHVVSGTLLLYPEESAWLCSMGALILKDPQGKECPLEDIYEMLFSKHDGWIDYNRYQVYAFLRRLGFIVQRAQATTIRDGHEDSISRISRWLKYMWMHFQNVVMTVVSRIIGTFPLICDGRYTTFEQVYSVLRIIPSTAGYRPFQSQDFCDWNVYKPNPKWKKNDSGPPDYKIFVISANNPLSTVRKLHVLSGDSIEPAGRRPYIPVPYICSRSPAASFLAAVVDDAEGVSFLQLTKGNVADIANASSKNKGPTLL